MVGAYAVRRLSESYRLSDELQERRLEVTRFGATGRLITTLTRDQIDRNYQLEHGTKESRSAVKLCNTIIHSFVWILSADESGVGFDGVYVSSDRDKARSLLLVPLAGMLDLFRAVGDENIIGFQFRVDPETGEQTVRNFTPETIHLMDRRPGGLSVEQIGR